VFTRTVRTVLPTKIVIRTFTARFPQDDHGGCTPCFSLTCSGEERTPHNRLTGEWAGPASVADVQRYAPDLEDIRALHLADADGAPMHAEPNALYWAAGAASSPMGAKYHGGNGPDRRSPGECLTVLARHLRISERAATALINHVDMVIATHPHLYEVQKDVVRAFVDAQRVRWAQEATACVMHHYPANGGAEGHL
jgi:hypothetical protein